MSVKQSLKELAYLILVLITFMPDDFKVDEEKLANGLEEYVVDIIKNYKGE